MKNSDTMQMSTQKALVVIASMMFLIGLSLVVPGRYVGLKNKRPPLVLREIENIQKLADDKDNNKVPDWRDIAINNLSPTTKEQVKKVTVDADAKKRLDDPNNLTASFSKNLYMSSAFIKKNGGTLTAKEQENLVSSLLQAEEKKIITKKYSVSDITISKNETVSSKKAYGNALGTLLKKGATYKLAQGDLKAMEAYTTSKDKTILQAFVIKRNNVDSLIKSMLAINVPYSAVPYHILAVNRLSAYRTIVDSFSKGETDPIRSAIVVNTYVDVTQSMLNALNAMKDYFRISAITFSPNEPGYFLTATIIN